MYPSLSQKQIGQRINILRKTKGLSQIELAKSINIPRPSLAQIELGSRAMDILEFQRLSMVLGFSLDDFVSQDFAIGLDIEEIAATNTQNKAERISTPFLKVNKLINIILYILEKHDIKSNIGEDCLNNLLYFSDYNYYELHEEHLTGATYHKTLNGLKFEKLETIIQKMNEKGLLQKEQTEYDGLTHIRYLPLVKADLTKLKASEKEVIDNVIQQFSGWDIASIESYAQKDMPYLASKEGGEIDYELAFYRESPYSVRSYADETEE